jgi:ABC-type polysaccharide/polyol phosphate transport system ATPase subunit
MIDAVWLDDVSLWRRSQTDEQRDLKRTIFSLLKGERKAQQRNQVLKNVNLVVRPGEKIAIVGANGSGKSTLLKVICGVLRPTSGLVQVRGNIAALIELGAGFDGEISAFENLVSYGIMLGFSKREIKQRASAILEWAELSEYRNVPVKTFSTGMSARLGFALATEAQPDLLIIDETLSVGDEHFRHRCEERIARLWANHATVILVSHDLHYVRNSCPRAVWLDRGNIVANGRTDEVVDAYLARVANLEAMETPGVLAP